MIPQQGSKKSIFLLHGNTWHSWGGTRVPYDSHDLKINSIKLIWANYYNFETPDFFVHFGRPLPLQSPHFEGIPNLWEVGHLNTTFSPELHPQPESRSDEKSS